MTGQILQRNDCHCCTSSSLHFTSLRHCPSTAGCSPPSMPSIVVYPMHPAPGSSLLLCNVNLPPCARWSSGSLSWLLTYNFWSGQKEKKKEKRNWSFWLIQLNQHFLPQRPLVPSSGKYYCHQCKVYPWPAVHSCASEDIMRWCHSEKKSAWALLPAGDLPIIHLAAYQFLSPCRSLQIQWCNHSSP